MSEPNSQVPSSIMRQHTELPNYWQRHARIRACQQLIANQAGITVEELLEKRVRRHKAFEQRHIAVYLASRVTSNDYYYIGVMFKGLREWVVRYSIVKIELKRQEDPEFDKLIQSHLDTLLKSA